MEVFLVVLGILVLIAVAGLMQQRQEKRLQDMEFSLTSPPPDRVFPSGGPGGKGGTMPAAPGPVWDMPDWDPETVQKVIDRTRTTGPKLDVEHFNHLMRCEGRKSPNTPEPPPTGDGVPVWELVIADMKERDHVGRAKYGTPLRTHNGRRPLVDAYQEVLDLAVYLRQEIEEMKHDGR